MNENKNISKSQNTTRMLLAMVGIGLACAILIGVTFETTSPIIKEKKKEALEKAIFHVLPDITRIEPLVIGEDGLKAEDAEGSADNKMYGGYNDQGELTGIAIEARGQGYADIIRILFGYDPVNERIVGFEVLETKETPGLGDKIVKDQSFLQNFNSLDVRLNNDRTGKVHPIVTVKHGQKQNPWQIDGITGATISSRAVGQILETGTEISLPLIQNNLEQIKQKGKRLKGNETR